MKLDRFERKGKSNLLDTAARVEKSSNDVLESAGGGFAFPLPEALRTIDPAETLPISESGGGISKVELLKTTLRAMKDAWEKEIEPRLAGVRSESSIKAKGGKQSTDFFTEADVASEKVIRDAFLLTFGADKVRIFGEEASAYVGNTESLVGIRIDPIDGTESMKFGKPDWGIIIGVYAGTPEKEKLVMGATYHPEQATLIVYVDEHGVFVEDLQLGEIKKVENTETQDSLDNIIIELAPHRDLSQRGKIADVQRALEEKGARIRNSSSCAEVLEALLTHGKRAMIMEGDSSQVDFPPFSYLRSVGYLMYDWKGKEVNPDDSDAHTKKLVVVPPGKAGKQILRIVKKFV